MMFQSHNRSKLDTSGVYTRFDCLLCDFKSRKKGRCQMRTLEGRSDATSSYVILFCNPADEGKINHLWSFNVDSKVYCMNKIVCTDAIQVIPGQQDFVFGDCHPFLLMCYLWGYVLGTESLLFLRKPGLSIDPLGYWVMQHVKLVWVEMISSLIEVP